jgi:erythromycin esterase-like protein
MWRNTDVAGLIEWMRAHNEGVAELDQRAGYLSGAYPGYGYGAMDAYDGYVSYRALDEEALAPEIAETRALIEGDWRTLEINRRETAAAISACKIIIMALLCSSVACVWWPREPEPTIMVSPSTLISRRN